MVLAVAVIAILVMGMFVQNICEKKKSTCTAQSYHYTCTPYTALSVCILFILLVYLKGTNTEDIDTVAKAAANALYFLELICKTSPLVGIDSALIVQ